MRRMQMIFFVSLKTVVGIISTFHAITIKVIIILLISSHFFNFKHKYNFLLIDMTSTQSTYILYCIYISVCRPVKYKMHDEA
jgi:hypothetical protein